MPRYRIRVAHRDTGKESMFVADGDSARGVEDQAIRDGWLVAEVTELPPRPTIPAATMTRGFFGLTGLGCILMLLAIAGAALHHTNTANRDAMSASIRDSHRRSHAFQEDVAVGSMANDLHDMLYEVEKMRGEVRDDLNETALWGLFWAGMIVLVFAETWRRGRKS